MVKYTTTSPYKSPSSRKRYNNNNNNNNNNIDNYKQVILIILVLLLFTSFTYYSHIQLDTHQQITNATPGAVKIFVTNSLKKLEDFEETLEKTILHNKWISSNRESYESYIQTLTSNSGNGNSINGINDIDISSYYHQLSCPNSELLTFWKPPTLNDLKYRSPFADTGPNPKYVTFEPDVGGWNNIRMQMELVIVFAAATGRILVLPPDQPMYLLDKGKGHQKAHSFADFFPFDYINKRLQVITMDEFMAREAITGHLKKPSGEVYYPPGNKTTFIGTDRDDRNAMWEYLRNVTSAPKWKCMKDFLVIPPGPHINVSLLPNADEYRKRRDIFAASRTPNYYDDYWQDQFVVHFISKPGLGYRLLEHFYTFIHFEDIEMDKYYKRFVRDYVHYIDTIFCTASIIIKKLLDEGGVYSAFHIRRGEFQYKEVKISADALMENVGNFIPANELIYIATDDKNKSSFNPFKKRFPTIRFLDDYFELAGLGNLNPNFLGMIDQVICTRGNIFVGTWFSTFSGYITRMRGYMGKLDSTIYYGDKKHRDRFQHPELPMYPFYMR